MALAVDFVTMAIRDEYDVGILLSTDADLAPAIEFVAEQTAGSGRRAEVAGWSGRSKHTQRLSVPGLQLWCHWLNREAYNKVADPTNYHR